MTTGQDAIVDVKALGTKKLVAYFQTLEALKLEEMNGEYESVLLKQPSLIAEIASVRLSNPVWPSRFDGKPSYQLVYRAYYSVPAMIHMVDEVRCLEPGVYVGIGTYGLIEAQRRILYPFLVTGPTETYRGDIGNKREGFSVKSELSWL